MQKIGLIGYGKAGQAVASVFARHQRHQLCWVARRRAAAGEYLPEHPSVPIVGLQDTDFRTWLDQYPVDAVVDFSNAESVFEYGEELARRRITLVSAISAYSDAQLDYLRKLGERTRVLSSPNITLGINFLLLASKLLREIAPFADVEIVEQHFREKPECSGTARKIAATLQLEETSITSLRLGGIVGHHEVIFGFPHQTVRLIHDSIRREAFGTGAAFALDELAHCGPGFYTLEELLMKKIRSQLLEAAA